MQKKIKMWCRHAYLLPVYCYKYILSPVLPKACRYYPTCSAYAMQAVLMHGIIRGSWLALKRIARCNPWAEGGVDPVPPPSCATQKAHSD